MLKIVSLISAYTQIYITPLPQPQFHYYIRGPQLPIFVFSLGPVGLGNQILNACYMQSMISASNQNYVTPHPPTKLSLLNENASILISGLSFGPVAPGNQILGMLQSSP